jgi:hypothetical protein
MQTQENNKKNNKKLFLYKNYNSKLISNDKLRYIKVSEHILKLTLKKSRVETHKQRKWKD